jgi:NTE family protein
MNPVDPKSAGMAKTTRRCVMGSALVLGGGGVAGIAWTIGVLAGMAAEGTDVTGADLLVGTSAGSAVAAQIGSGEPLEELYRRQVDPARQVNEIRPTGISVPEIMAEWARLAEEVTDPGERRRHVGRRALAAETVPEAARRAVIEERLPSWSWPERPMLITAVAAETGEPCVFDRDSGVPLVDAVEASCAVPMVWPTVPIDGVRYMDGGTRTSVNADLAAGHTPVVIVAPLPDPDLEADIAELAAHGRVELITPDDPSLVAIGVDPLDPATRTPAAQAGRAQGAGLAAKLAELVR